MPQRLTSCLGPNKRPSWWFRLDITKDLIRELKQGDFQVADMILDPVHVVHGGAKRGTYAVRELVYAYAMWISPAFNLAVIRAFDASQNSLHALPAPQERTAPAVKFRSMDSAFRQMMKVALICGCTPRQAAEHAAIGVEKHWGVNPLKEMNLLPESRNLFDHERR